MEPPAGSGWIHEIKHDGFRIMARRDETGVRLYTRNGYNFANRFPRIVEAIAKLPVQSCFIDGEAIVIDERGLSTFELLRSWRHDHAAVLCAFDVIELDGRDLRWVPIEQRKHALANLLFRGSDGIIFNSTIKATVRSSSRRRARSAVRASSQSGSVRTIALAGSRIG
jgi:bifunctional non-homologous end joining protein LigD